MAAHLFEALTWDGQIRTCCGSEKVFGDLNRKGIMEIWNGEEFTAFRKAFAVGAIPFECKDCVENHRQKFELRATGETIGLTPKTGKRSDRSR